MKMKTWCCLAALIGTQTVMAQQVNNDWENPLLYERNKEKPHASFMLFTAPAEVVADDYSRSTYYQSLNGSWRFSYVDKHENRPKDFYQAGYDDSRWSEIRVPSNWEMKGFGVPI